MKKSIPEATKPSSRKGQLIQLTRIKQWWLPVSADDYRILRDAGIPMVRIPVAFLPTLQLLTKKHRIHAKEVNFKDEILDPFLDSVGTTWNKKPHCRATITSRQMKFETLKPEVYTKAKESIARLEEFLSTFFVRWGFNHRFEYSENRGKCKLNVEYFFDSNKMPIIPLETRAADLPKIYLKLGFVRLVLAFGPTEVDLIYEISQGGKFVPYHSTKCLYSQISSVKPMVTALISVLDKDIHNFDNSHNP